jgi:hypothetical protein
MLLKRHCCNRVVLGSELQQHSHIGNDMVFVSTLGGRPSENVAWSPKSSWLESQSAGDFNIGTQILGNGRLHGPPGDHGETPERESHELCLKLWET